MPTKPISFSDTQVSSAESLGGAPELVVNLLKDPAGWLRLFPGSSTWSFFGSTAPRTADVIGMYVWKNYFIWVDQAADGTRYVYASLGAGAIKTLSTTTASTQLGGSLPPVFAGTKNYLFIAGGAGLIYWDGIANTMAAVPDTRLPTNISHVAGIAQRVVALAYDNTGQFYWTDPGETNFLTKWRALNYAEAEADPDAALAMFANSRELYIFGARTVQTYVPDGNIIFAPQVTQQVGLTSRSSVINLQEKQAFAWLDHKLDLVVGDIRSEPQVISGPIDRSLKTIDTPADCRGYRVRLANADLLVWSFRVSGRVFAYELTQSRWFELRVTDTQGEWAAWPATAHFYWPEKGVTLVGLPSGVIQKLDETSDSIYGYPIIGEAWTGFQDQGTLKTKQTTLVNAQMRRGEHGESSEPVAELYFRDLPGAWKRPLRFGLGTLSSKRPVLTQRLTTAPYEKRQWRLRLATPGVTVGPFEEEFEIMEY